MRWMRRGCAFPSLPSDRSKKRTRLTSGWKRGMSSGVSCCKSGVTRNCERLRSERTIMKLCNELPRTILNLAAVVMLSVSGVSMLRAATEMERLNWHSDTSTKIDSGNVAQLKLAWKIATETSVSHRPLVENGRVYFADWSGHATAAD